MLIDHSMGNGSFTKTLFRKCFDWFHIYDATYSIEIFATFHFGESLIFI